MSWEITKGTGNTRITLQADPIGNDLVVRIFNIGAHIGAAAVAEYDSNSQRVSVSVVTRLGHKDDVIAQKAAYTLCKFSHQPTCVIAGIHIPDITPDEIGLVTEITSQIIEEFKIRYLEK